jgi:hypothetical protein
MMNTESTDLATSSRMLPEAVEKAVVGGDLSKLNTQERLAFYLSRCQAAGLDPRARPFEYVSLQGKLTLYATKACTDQLSVLHGISHEIVARGPQGDLYEALVRVRSRDGRQSEDVGVVDIRGLRGHDLANAAMKAVTKAKRRAILSLCGLGDVVEATEVETCRDVRQCTPSGELQAPENRSSFGRGQYCTEEQANQYLDRLDAYLQKRNAEWLDWWTQPDGSIPLAVRRDLICNRWQADNHLVKWAIATGRLDPASMPEGGIKSRQIGRYTGIIYHHSTGERKALTHKLRRYIDEEARLATEKLRRDQPELFAGYPAEELTEPDDCDLEEPEGSAAEEDV